MAQPPILQREKPVVRDLEDGMKQCIRMRMPVILLRVSPSVCSQGGH